MADPFDLQRFVKAQQSVYPAALAELRAGSKRTHWIWFIFPQVIGLGHSAMAQRYAIKSRDEAMAYLDHPLLGPRLLECTAAVLAVPQKSAHEIFGSPDDMKFRSSMTLFEAVGGDHVFGDAIDRFYQGKRDQATLDILASWAE
jgi:uncharacterized protein (DUF1810 family)